ncbi:MAG: ATP-binding protein [Pseudomonadota bacterium]
MAEDFALRGLAHDLCNMLSPAMLHASVLAQAEVDDRCRRAESIMAALERALALLEREIDSPKAPGEDALPSDLDALIALACESAVDGTAADFTVGVPLGLEIRPNRQVAVFRILFNLVHNAARAGGSSLVRLRFLTIGADAAVEVEDAGPGLPLAVLSWFREPCEDITGEEVRGHGIGLLTTRVLVEGLGGTLAVGRTGEAGTVMRVNLPDVLEPREALLERS